VVLLALRDASAAPAAAVLNSVFPPGCRSGESVEVTVTGSGLAGVAELRCSHPAITCSTDDGKRFRLTVPADVPPGQYDLSARTGNGLSSVRTFVVGSLPEQAETADNHSLETAEPIPLNSVTNGRIEQAGDVDCFQFNASQGQRVVLCCQAEQIDSPLRAVLEVFDAAGRRVAVNRGFRGIDPLIRLDVPADGPYQVRVFDLVYAGSADHVYRLSVHTGPHVVFAVPCAVPAAHTSRVRLYGWNLSGEGVDGDYETTDVEVTPPEPTTLPSPFRLLPSQIEVPGFAYHSSGSPAPVRIGVTDQSVTETRTGHQSPSTAVAIAVPAEVSGQLLTTGQLDWYRIDARRGEVLWLEAYGERLGSPVDLDLSVLDPSGERELARFSDQKHSIGDRRFPTAHADPYGRWVAPDDGAYLILVRSLTGGAEDDVSRVYRLSVRREEPDFELAFVPDSDEPVALNIPRGGRVMAEVLAFRRRGLTESIRVAATDLPAGIECPEVWLGPGVNRVPLVISAADQTEDLAGRLNLEGFTVQGGHKPVHGGTVVRKNAPAGWSRLTDRMEMSVSGDASIRISANGHETRPHDLFGELEVRHSPGSILDVAVEIERREIGYQADVTLTGIGLPGLIRNATVIIPAGRSRGYLSFYLPPVMPVGHYTIAVQGETTVPTGPPDAQGRWKTEKVTVVTNAVTFEVQPAAFRMELDPEAPRKIRRGEVLQVQYAAPRINGFIGKIHTELSAPEGVHGIRGRGVTFVGQSDRGTIQIIANDDAAPGRLPFLRLYAVGVVEDQPVYHGSCFLPLEIVE